MRQGRELGALGGDATTVAADDMAERDADSSLRFSTAGTIPPVGGEFQTAALSPSDRAYGQPRSRGRDAQRDELSAEGRIMERIDATDGKAIAEASRRFDIPEADILAIITQESRGVATANAGARQRDGGRNAASGLMQVTRETWNNTLRNHPELKKYPFDQYRYVRHINILVGTAALSDKRTALTRLGVDTGENSAALLTMAYNAGEGIVAEAFRRAERAGSQQPDVDCLRAEHLKPAIAKYPSVYSYYLTGGGKSRNPQRTKQKAIDLKYEEISKYPTKVQMLVAEAHEHGIADTSEDVPDLERRPPTMLASADGGGESGLA